MRRSYVKLALFFSFLSANSPSAAENGGHTFSQKREVLDYYPKSRFSTTTPNDLCICREVTRLACPHLDASSSVVVAVVLYLVVSHRCVRNGFSNTCTKVPPGAKRRVAMILRQEPVPDKRILTQRIYTNLKCPVSLLAVPPPVSCCERRQQVQLVRKTTQLLWFPQGEIQHHGRGPRHQVVGIQGACERGTCNCVFSLLFVLYIASVSLTGAEF